MATNTVLVHLCYIIMIAKVDIRSFYILKQKQKNLSDKRTQLVRSWRDNLLFQFRFDLKHSRVADFCFLFFCFFCGLLQYQLFPKMVFTMVLEIY